MTTVYDLIKTLTQYQPDTKVGVVMDWNAAKLITETGELILREEEIV